MFLKGLKEDKPFREGAERFTMNLLEKNRLQSHFRKEETLQKQKKSRDAKNQREWVFRLG